MTKIIDSLKIQVSVQPWRWTLEAGKPVWVGYGAGWGGNTRYITVWLGNVGFYPYGGWAEVVLGLDKWPRFHKQTSEQMVPDDVGRALLRQHRDYQCAPEWLRQFAEEMT